jgi:hypothetical protein
MPRQPIEAEIHYVDDQVLLVVPQQAGLAYEEVAARLAAFAEELQAELGLPVEIVGGPERHTHGPQKDRVRTPGQVSFGSR